MELDGSLSCSQERAIGPYPEPDPIHTFQTFVPEIHF
jgi:hypothetical protein